MHTSSESTGEICSVYSHCIARIHATPPVLVDSTSQQNSLVEHMLYVEKANLCHCKARESQSSDPFPCHQCVLWKNAGIIERPTSKQVVNDQNRPSHGRRRGKKLKENIW